MVCVSSLIYRTSINPGTRGRVTCVRLLLPGMFMSEPCLLAVWFLGLQVKKRRACSCLAAPALQNHEWLMMPSRGGCLTLAPNQFPPNCGGPVWLRYQLVRGMAGRQERIKRSCKEKREDGSTSLAVMKLFRCTGKQASPRSAWKPRNNGLILPVRSFLCFCFLFGPSQMSFDLSVSTCCSMCSISTQSVRVFWEVGVLTKRKIIKASVPASNRSIQGGGGAPVAQANMQN